LVDFFGLPEQVEALEALLVRPAEPAARLESLVHLAWYLRQRDTARALMLATEAERLAEWTPDTPPDRRSCLSARLSLVRAEAQTLRGELDAAEELLTAALTAFRTEGDGIGEGDARMVESWLAFDLGQSGRRAEVLAAAVQCYARAGDELRLHLAEACLARESAYRDPVGAEALWSARLGNATARGHAGLTALCDFFRGVLAFATSDYVQAARFWQQGQDQALASGQVRMAVMMSLGCGTAFDNVNDQAEALTWMERGRALARPTGWPSVIGFSLVQASRPLRRLGQHQRGLALVRDGLRHLKGFKQSRAYGTGLQYLGDALLDTGDFPAALEAYRDCEALGRRLGQVDLLMEGLRGQAHAFARLDRPEEALRSAEQALSVSRNAGDRGRQLEALRVLADIHRRYPLPVPDGMLAPNARIHFLHKALSVAETIEGLIPSADLFADVAAAYADIADYATAYKFERRAGEAREKSRSKQASDRMLAIEVRFETERARAEAENHRRLAAAEAERAEAAHRSLQTLEQLGQIGQGITATLDADAVFRELRRSIGNLMDADGLVIFILVGDRLEMRYGVEDGRALQAHAVPLDDAHSIAARAARERRELLVELAHATAPRLIPGTVPMPTALFAPLMVGSRGREDRVLGVLSVQSRREKAYGERERLILRTLCAYGAIALANAEAYRTAESARAAVADALQELKSTQARLIQQEKLASLGRTVAGVAHEINTPVGIAMTTASHLRTETERFVRSVREGSIRRSDLDAFAELVDETTAMMEANLQRAADLVHSFKQVAADQTRDAARRIDLVDYLREVVTSLEPMLRKQGIAIRLTGAPGLTLVTRPGPLAQVVINLVQNAVVHGFADRPARPMHPEIVITATADGPDHVRLTVADNGTGMTAEVQNQAFEPFYTTRRDSGGTGLGLHIVHSIVTGALGGTVDLDSEPGRGTTVDLRLPGRLSGA